MGPELSFTYRVEIGPVGTHVTIVDGEVVEYEVKAFVVGFGIHGQSSYITSGPVVMTHREPGNGLLEEVVTPDLLNDSVELERRIIPEYDFDSSWNANKERRDLEPYYGVDEQSIPDVVHDPVSRDPNPDHSYSGDDSNGDRSDYDGGPAGGGGGGPDAGNANNPPSPPGGKSRRRPIILDLDGDGVELVSLKTSTAFFDGDKDGFREQVGWAGADDGFLAIDLDGDGAVSGADEFMFAERTAADETNWRPLRNCATVMGTGCSIPPMTTGRRRECGATRIRTGRRTRASSTPLRPLGSRRST